QFAEQLAALFEAHYSSDRGHHAGDGGAERGIAQTQRLVPRTEASLATLAMIIGAFQPQRTQSASQGFGAAVHVTSRLATGARQPRPRIVRPTRVQPLLESPRRQP